ncbi:hypothetical protein BU24DRAFT_472556 [Aaosphaeria arxii CBS 175.79]|uniref:Aminoglycoside phosphotransferase domain-containing protein n=1 Tax=Aaosphaeria arxii CBS 175.79 TaxID=1450172 RepID=A0A6A5XC29_9PLEO|nr:uncharacterized protein BU24DRAFT_472556 [Aaosphaeria arxii CBS 175.79]KAF2010376.1 hypothetical protein BU24DRAFT_472556 [Aaosphaeria arxii CBS 175.79]
MGAKGLEIVRIGFLIRFNGKEDCTYAIYWTMQLFHLDIAEGVMLYLKQSVWVRESGYSDIKYVTPILSGTTNYTYRVMFRQEGSLTVTDTFLGSIILKHAPEYLLGTPHIPFAAGRQVFEASAMSVVPRVLTNDSSILPVELPVLIHHDPAARVIFMQDLSSVDTEAVSGSWFDHTMQLSQFCREANTPSHLQLLRGAGIALGELATDSILHHPTQENRRPKPYRTSNIYISHGKFHVDAHIPEATLCVFDWEFTTCAPSYVDLADFASGAWLYAYSGPASDAWIELTSNVFRAYRDSGGRKDIKSTEKFHLAKGRWERKTAALAAAKRILSTSQDDWDVLSQDTFLGTLLRIASAQGREKEAGEVNGSALTLG